MLTDSDVWKQWVCKRAWQLGSRARHHVEAENLQLGEHWPFHKRLNGPIFLQTNYYFFDYGNHVALSYETRGLQLIKKGYEQFWTVFFKHLNKPALLRKEKIPVFINFEQNKKSFRRVSLSTLLCVLCSS